jgi:hypothetical protein
MTEQQWRTGTDPDALDPAVIFRQLFDPQSSTYSYVLGDQASHEALLIDPVFAQARRDAALIKELGLWLRATLETHVHADHVTGLDDLRRFNWLQRAPLTCYGDADTLRTVERMFPYAFDHRQPYISSKPQLQLCEIDGPFDLYGQNVVPIPLFHGPMPVLGFRFGRFAYCTDCSVIPEASFDLLKDLDVLVLDALRHKPHPTHFTLEQAVEAGRIRTAVLRNQPTLRDHQDQVFRGLVEPLGGVDISWIVGLFVPGILYYAFGRTSRLRAPPQLILPA